MPRRHKKMTGGFWESLSQSFGDAWNKTKKATTDAYSSATTQMTTPTITTPTTTTPTTTTSSTGYMGGRKKRKTRRHMKGGYSDNTQLTGLAASAQYISGIKSAEPLTIVGGKKKTKRRQKQSKSRKH